MSCTARGRGLLAPDTTLPCPRTALDFAARCRNAPRRAGRPDRHVARPSELRLLRSIVHVHLCAAEASWPQPRCCLVLGRRRPRCGSPPRRTSPARGPSRQACRPPVRAALLGLPCAFALCAAEACWPRPLRCLARGPCQPRRGMPPARTVSARGSASSSMEKKKVDCRRIDDALRIEREGKSKLGLGSGPPLRPACVALNNSPSRPTRAACAARLRSLRAQSTKVLNVETRHYQVGRSRPAGDT